MVFKKEKSIHNLYLINKNASYTINFNIIFPYVIMINFTNDFRPNIQ